MNEARRLLAEALRVTDPARIRRIAAGGGPRYEGDLDAVYCSLCSCNRSGDVDEPNGKTEACTDDHCACHDDDDDGLDIDVPRELDLNVLLGHDEEEADDGPAPRVPHGTACYACGKKLAGTPGTRRRCPACARKAATASRWTDSGKPIPFPGGRVS